MEDATAKLLQEAAMEIESLRLNNKKLNERLEEIEKRYTDFEQTLNDILEPIGEPDKSVEEMLTELVARVQSEDEEAGEMETVMENLTDRIEDIISSGPLATKWAMLTHIERTEIKHQIERALKP